MDDSDKAWAVVAAMADVTSPYDTPFMVPAQTLLVLAAMCQAMIELRDAQTVLGEAYLDR